MKKVFKWWLMALLVCLPAVALTSCGDDDDEPSSSTGVAGNWYTEYDDVCVLKSNGKFVAYADVNLTLGTYEDIWDGTWTYNKDTGVLTTTDSDGTVDIYKVISVSDNTMTLMWYDDEGDEFDDTEIWTRIKDSQVPTTYVPY